MLSRGNLHIFLLSQAHVPTVAVLNTTNVTGHCGVNESRITIQGFYSPKNKTSYNITFIATNVRMWLFVVFFSSVEVSGFTSFTIHLVSFFYILPHFLPLPYSSLSFTYSLSSPLLPSLSPFSLPPLFLSLSHSFLAHRFKTMESE